MREYGTAVLYATGGAYGVLRIRMIIALVIQK